MNRFYQSIEIYHIGDGSAAYYGSVLVGVSLRDQKGLIVQVSKKRYLVNKEITSESKSTGPVCGRETNTASGWIPIEGPIKGFYIVKNGEDHF